MTSRQQNEALKLQGETFDPQMFCFTWTNKRLQLRLNVMKITLLCMTLLSSSSSTHWMLTTLP